MQGPVSPHRPAEAWSQYEPTSDGLWGRRANPLAILLGVRPVARCGSHAALRHAVRGARRGRIREGEIGRKKVGKHDGQSALSKSNGYITESQDSQASTSEPQSASRGVPGLRKGLQSTVTRRGVRGTVLVGHARPRQSSHCGGPLHVGP